MGFTIAGMGLAEPLEREAELMQLSALLNAAQVGRGQVCVIEGPSGVGKSRLLDECALRRQRARNVGPAGSLQRAAA